MLVGERRIQSTVDRYSPLIPFRAIAGLHLYVQHFTDTGSSQTLQVSSCASNYKCCRRIASRVLEKLRKVYTRYLAEQPGGKLYP